MMDNSENTIRTVAMTIDEALPILRDKPAGNPRGVNPSEQENLKNASSLGKVWVQVAVAFWSDRGMKK